MARAVSDRTFHGAISNDIRERTHTITLANAKRLGSNSRDDRRAPAQAAFGSAKYEGHVAARGRGQCVSDSRAPDLLSALKQTVNALRIALEASFTRYMYESDEECLRYLEE